MEYVFLILAMFAIYIVYKLFRYVKVNQMSKTLFEATAKNDEVTFLKVLENDWGKLFFSPYYKYLAKIKFYRDNDQLQKMEMLCDEIVPLVKIRLKERVGLLNPLFAYFVEKRNEEYTMKVYQALSNCFETQKNGDAYMEEMNLLLDIYIHPNVKRIEQLKELIANTEGADKEVCQYRLATLYANLKRKDEAIRVVKEIKSVQQNPVNLDRFVKEYLN